MHEHPLGTDGIEGVVGEAESLCVADFECYRKASTGGPANGFGDQRFAEVHACDHTAWANRGHQLEGVSAYAAADVQHFHSSLQAKTIQD
jgi:hypothetical protein